MLTIWAGHFFVFFVYLDINIEFLLNLTYISIDLEMAFSPDGQNILKERWDKPAKLWNLPGQKMQNIKGHKSRIETEAISPDGKSILIGSYNGTAELWFIPKDFLSQKIHRFTLQDFYGMDVQLYEVYLREEGFKLR
jgi:WD40 repeat protein